VTCFGHLLPDASEVACVDNEEQEYSVILQAEDWDPEAFIFVIGFVNEDLPQDLECPEDKLVLVTASPTKTPTVSPTPIPTTSPTRSPTQTPTPAPTSSPTPNPTQSPTCSVDSCSGFESCYFIINWEEIINPCGSCTGDEACSQFRGGSIGYNSCIHEKDCSLTKVSF